MDLGQRLRHRRQEKGLTQDQVAGRVEISKPYLSNIETGRAKNPPSDRVLEAFERVLDFEPGELVRLANFQRTPDDVRDEHERLRSEVGDLRAALQQLIRSQDEQEPSRTDAGGIDLDDIVKLARGEGNVERLSPGVRVPIINSVAAGYPQVFTDLDYPTSVADDYIRCPDVHDPHAFAARVVGDSMEPNYREGDIVIFAPSQPARSGDDCFVRFTEDRGTTFKRLYQDRERTLRLQPLNNRYPSETYPAEEIDGLWPAVYRVQPLRRR